ncbi:MAG TPA: trigger factor [Fimbriimonas sp.]|nr:trigger factor [Fimbriimonas sp.]
MQVTREDLNACTVKFSVKAEEQEVKDAFDKALKQISKQIKLPGFRPGHAPKAMVEKMVSKEEMYDNAAENLIRSLYRRILEENELQVDTTTRPTVDLTALDQDAHNAEFTIKVPLPPKVTLGDYKGLPVEVPAIGVTDEEVQTQIDEFRKRRQTREAVTDRGVQEGDVAVVNIKPDGAEGEGRNFMTIAGQTFPELDQALLGMQVEDMKSLDLPFPANFQEKDWANQTMHVQVTLNSLSTVRLPELDDEFAKSLQTENIDDLKLRVRAGIERAKQQMLRDFTTEQLLEKLHERSEVAVSDNMWEALADRRLSETAQEQQKEGKNLEQYAQENGMTVEQLQQAWRDKAKMHVERALLIRELFVAEKMELTNQELNDELISMAEEMQTEPQELLDILRKNEALDELQFRAISRKVGNFLEANAEKKELTAA